MTRAPIRIAVLQFSHETVTFLPNDTTIDDFTYPGSPAAGEALLNTDPRGYMGGFVQVAREHDNVELIGIESPQFPKTGSGSGWLTEATYEHFAGRMIAGLKAAGKIDGVYLCVHGAMAARGVARPEAELARRVRAVVGPQARIAGTFDPHGNEDAEFLVHADMAFCVKYFPHYDSHLQGQRAARMLIRAIRGDYDAQTVTVRVPIISPTVLQWTGERPWMDFIQRALIWEAREPDAYVNVFFGFPWSDVPDAGMTIQAMTNGNAERARQIADDMAAWAWRRRKDLLSTTQIHGMADGVKLARDAIARGATPVILADYSDRSGYATWLLREIVQQDLSDTLVATVTDAPALERLGNAKAGDPFEMEIGGKFDESAGAPVPIRGTVHSVIERAGERWLSVKFGRNNVLVITPYLEQIIEPSTLSAIGFDPAAFKVIAIKSRAHFRRGFDDSGFAKTIMLVEPPHPFLGTVHLDALPYRNVDLKAFYPYGEPKFP